MSLPSEPVALQPEGKWEAAGTSCTIYQANRLKQP